MKSSGKIIGFGILFVIMLAAAVSGERTVSGSKTSTKAELVDKPASPATAGGADETIRQPHGEAAVSVSAPATTSSEALTDEGMTENMSFTTEAAAEANVYEISWQSINAGGGDMQSATYQLSSSAGQSAIGYSTSTSYQMGGGYWYGMGGTSGDCFCGGPYPSFGDITCDNAVNPIDVVKMVNFVYKNIDNRCSDDWVCPYEPGDVNCDSAVNPVDVVRYVNYVYKNITPFPCDPCE